MPWLSKVGVWFERWGLPTLIATTLVGAVAIDLVSVVRAPAPAGVDLLGSPDIRFEPRDWPVDLRSEHPASGTVAVGPIYSLTAGWAAQDADGALTDGPRAELTLDLPVGGQRVLIVQCRLVRPPGPTPDLVVLGNGEDLGSIPLDRPLAVYRVRLGERLIGAGENRFELRLETPDGSGHLDPESRLLVRRMVLADRPDASFEAIAFRRPVTVNPGAGVIVMHAPGRLLIPFRVPAAGSELTFGYVFRGRAEGVRCAVGVGRRFPDLDAVDVMERTELSGGPGSGGTVRLHLGNHVGPALLWLTAERTPNGLELAVRQPRVVGAVP